MASSPRTIHFCVSQLGSHEWLIKRPKAPCRHNQRGQRGQCAHLAAGIDDLPVADVHKVIVPRPGCQVKVLALLVLLLLKHLSHVLDDKLTGADGHLGKEAIALGARPPLW